LRREGKEMMKRLVIVAVVVLSLGLGIVPCLRAQNFPVKPIEIIVPYTAGASMDIMARVVADRAPKYLGQPVVVVNKPGAGGIIGGADIINSKPDGYKLITLTNFFFATTVKTQKMTYDPNMMVPIANCMMYKMGLFIRGDSPWKTLDDLLDYARKNPGKVTWGHHGRGITIHMAALLIFKKAGVQTLEIPQKGSPESLAALLGGHIDASTSNYGPFKPHLESGKVRCLILYSDRRFSDLPGVPHALELGYPDVEKVTTFIGLYAHKNTPENVKRFLMDGFKKTCEDDEVKKGILKLGEEPMYGAPEFAMRAIKKGEEVGVPLIKELGLYVDQK
jgi:tripartite-type tricarboxylate transporter receptor subunit TctC